MYGLKTEDFSFLQSGWVDNLLEISKCCNGADFFLLIEKSQNEKTREKENSQGGFLVDLHPQRDQITMLSEKNVEKFSTRLRMRIEYEPVLNQREQSCQVDFILHICNFH